LHSARGGNRSRPARAILFAVLALGQLSGLALAAGARSFKSGPIQITADGSTVWVVNPDHDSVSRLDTATDAVVEIPLPQPAGPPVRHNPLGLSVTEDGAEVWVACHDSDRVYVLRGSDGAVLARIDLPWGSGPHSVALSRDQTRALVTLLRAGRIAVIDRATRQIVASLESFRSPLGIAWMEDGVSAWITHRHVLDRLPRVSRIDVSPPGPRVTTQERTDGAGPQDNAALHDADPTHNVAEGGYLNFRGHLAQRPFTSRVWVPTQYDNRNQTVITPDSILQATLRQIDLTTRRIPNTINDKIILSAKQVHDPQTSAWLGPGWDLGASGPDDVAFSSDGATVYLVGELSENLLVMPASTPPYRDGIAPAPVLVTVGGRPQGVAVSPVAIGGRQLAYVANILSRDVSKVDVTSWSGAFEVRRIPVTPSTPEPRTPSFLNGDRLFHSSADPRVSSNRKVACGSCHIDGEQDGRAWDLQHLPGAHGPRQTQSILGLGLSMGPIDPVTGLGQLHRSGDRDEVQDFDHTFRGPQMGGTGFLAGAQLQPDLGAPNAGRDPDLDDVAEYVLTLPPLARSPRRNPDGTLSEAAVRGASFFLGSGARPADAKCASCHVPETGFVDFGFHDVGQRHDAGEAELNTRSPLWGVNTASLVGLWDSPPYVGASQAKDPETLVEEILDFRRPARTAPHGATGGLTGRQVQDLAEFLGSIDGSTIAAEVRGAADHAPPRVVRVEPASLTRVDAWFSESVAPAAATPAAWRLRAVGGPDVPILAASLDPQNGDRVTFTVATMHHDCGPVTYMLIPLGPILDLADTASGGTANALDVSDPSNSRTFLIGDTLTVTFGASGYENFTIPVHDSGTVYGSPAGANGTVWLRSNSGGTQRNTDFVRFEWETAFATTGVTSANGILDASFALLPSFGDSQVVEARRVLQRWWDYGGGDLTQNPVNPVNGHGGPTYTWSEFNVKSWNAPNAASRVSGINGQNVSDYLGTRDTAFDPDVVVTMSDLGQRTVFGGPGVLSAFRFWFQNPSLDQGYALQLTSAARQETRFHPGEEELKTFAPVLTLTYALPPTFGPPPPEVSALIVAGNTLSWSPLTDPVTYDIVAGHLEGLATAGLQPSTMGCVADNAPSASTIDQTAPPLGGGIWYLVRGTACGVPGSYGSGNPPQTPSRDAAIAASGRDCAP
jgi:DNA-binding beta-propeller fold protein YncE